MVQVNLLDSFELLVRVQSHLRETEIVRHNPMAYGYDLSRFVSENDYFDRWAAEEFVNAELERVRYALLNS